MNDKHIIIIGAGIGGLAVAAALRKARIAFTIYESAPAMRHGGAGIAVWANGLHALRQLGMQGIPDYFHTNHGAVAIRTAEGRTIMSAEAGTLTERYGALSAVLHREKLHELLWQLASKPEIRCNKQLVHYEKLSETQGHKVGAIFADGSTAEADALVACDGAGSNARKVMLGNKAPRYSGYTAWRGISDFQLTEPMPGESWGKGMRFGFFPLHDGRAYWFATRNARAETVYKGNIRDNLLEWFGDWHKPIGDLIRHTPEKEILRNDLYDRDPVHNWCDGNVILLGDAAHPTTPNLGQGGCMAIEDAATLGKCLTAETNIAAAFATCNKLRHERAAQLVLKARRIGAVGQWSWTPAIALRNFLMRAIGQRMQLRELDSIIGYRV